LVSATPVDVIIPVYNQLDLVLQCIASVRNANCATPHRIVVIDDCSPDRTVGSALAMLAAEGAIELHTNAQNLGFTRTVNYGMPLHPDRDVVLLNSDTIVYPQWLDRLQAAALSDPEIATANPISTQRGTNISCYPGLNHRFEGEIEVDGSQLDQCAREMNPGCYAMVDTTVGFCMYIRRAALNEIGYFDATNFPVGYGEETDFCYRARKAGWRHIIAGDVYVTHLGAKSFGEERKEKLLASIIGRFIALHPEYEDIFGRFLRNDPLLRMRTGIDCGRLRRMTDGQSALPVVSFADPTPTTRRIWLRFDPAYDTVLFEASGIPTGSTPNVGRFTLPQDLVRFNTVLKMVGIDRLVCASVATEAAFEKAIALSHPDEIGLQADLSLAPPAERWPPGTVH
jgi:GT2 family glycosyltransferase